MSHEIEIEIGLYNEYKLSVVKGDAEGNEIPGTRRDLTGWFHNLITDTGLENFGTLSASPQNWARGCRVGSSSTAPTFADTNIGAIIATTVNRLSVEHSRNLGASPPYIEKTVIYRFATGAAAGNLAEVGLVGATGDGSGTGAALNNATTCSTRALILDGGGSPTTVTVLADEILDVTCRQRLYIPGDVTGTITPSGGVSGAIDYVIRPCKVDQNPAVNDGGWGGFTSSYGWDFTMRYSSGYGETAAYVGASSAIGATTGVPTGTKVSSGSGGVTSPAYVAGSKYRDIENSHGLGTAGTGINDANGIGAHMFSYGACSFQIGYTPRIVKTSDMLFDVTIRLTWARYTP